MKKILLIITSIIFINLNALSAVIEGSVVMSDQVPKGFFGDWRVTSVCTKTTDKTLFGTKSMDIWTLTRRGEVITLMNPLSGARADITVNDVKGTTVKFEKKSSYPDEESIETPILTLNGDNFTGTDKIIIKTFKEGKLIKEDYVEYQVKGTKLSGDPVTGILGIY